MSAVNLSHYPQAFGHYEPSLTLSADGRYLAYVSYMNGSTQGNIFIHDTVTGTSRTVTGGAGAVLMYNENYSPALAANGSALAFTTTAMSWREPERIAVANLATGSISYASTNANGVHADASSHFASISADGRFVAFESAATNLVGGDTNGYRDVFVKDMTNDAISRVSLSTGGAQLDGDASGAQLSADGNVVLFRSAAAVLPGAASFLPQLYARNLATGALTMVSADGAGQPLDSIGEHAALSADGRYVVFSSASQFGGDANPNADIFRKDLVTGELSLVSADAASAQGGGRASAPSISSDGRYVSFAYDGGDLLAGTAQATDAIYVKDMESDALVLASPGLEPGAGAVGAISADGAHVGFASYAGILGDSYDVTWNVAMSTLTLQGAATEQGSSASNDLFTSTTGNDSWAGGAGRDTAAFHGRVAEYQIRAGAGSALVSDQAAGRDGADTLSGVERLKFADAMVALDSLGPEGLAGQAYRIYQAAFNRTPDMAGVGFWISTLDAGNSLYSVASGFTKSAEFATLYGTAPTNAHVVDLLYLNVLHRPGEAGGVAYWNNVLDKGIGDVAQVLAAFSESAENVAALVGVLEHGFAYLPYG